MNSPVVGLRVASLLAGLICLGQLARVLLHVRVMIGSHQVPLWMSGVAVLVAALVSAWFWKLTLPAQNTETHHEPISRDHPTMAAP